MIRVAILLALSVGATACARRTSGPRPDGAYEPHDPLKYDVLVLRASAFPRDDWDGRIRAGLRERLLRRIER